jgi:hypothetical protein
MSNQSEKKPSSEKASEPVVKEVGLQLNRSHVYVALFVFFGFIGGLTSGFLIWGRESPQDIPLVVATQPVDSNQVEGTQEAVRLEISVDDDPALGPADAPITIVEFSDFRCPYCSRFHLETFPDLMASFPDQIRFVYRDFPVVGGFEAALAANCANEQDAFWEFHD